MIARCWPIPITCRISSTTAWSIREEGRRRQAAARVGDPHPQQRRCRLRQLRLWHIWTSSNPLDIKKGNISRDLKPYEGEDAQAEPGLDRRGEVIRRRATMVDSRHQRLRAPRNDSAMTVPRHARALRFVSGTGHSVRLAALRWWLAPWPAALRKAAIRSSDAPQKALGVRAVPGNGSTQEPQAGVIPYDLNSPLFSDYADKYRFVKLPAGHKRQVQRRRGVRVSRRHGHRQDVCLSRRRPRSQAAAGGWSRRGFSSTSRTAGWACPISGTTSRPKPRSTWPATWSTSRWIDADGNQRTNNYIIPNSNQCKGCHKQGDALLPIGPKARHLNRDFAYADGTENQLAYWTAHQGPVRQLPIRKDAPRLAVWNDPADRQPRRAGPRLAGDQLCTLPQSGRAGPQLGLGPAGRADSAPRSSASSRRRWRPAAARAGATSTSCRASPTSRS